MSLSPWPWRNHTAASDARTVSSLARTVPVLERTIPSLAHSVPSLARTVPSLARTVLKPSVLQPRARSTRRQRQLVLTDGGWWTGRAVEKKHPFWKFLENCPIFFPDCFCSPQKSSKHIFRNIPNWKIWKFFHSKIA